MQIDLKIFKYLQLNNKPTTNTLYTSYYYTLMMDKENSNSQGANKNKPRTDALRKIEFDKGIPLSLDFLDNSVHTVQFHLCNMFVEIIKKIFKRPIFLAIIFLYILFIIGYIIDPEEVMKMRVIYPMLPHALFIIIEFIEEFINFFLIMNIDSDTNKQRAQVYDFKYKEFISVYWQDIRVGHIIKVERDEIVPADILILEAMDKSHVCYVDESSITGVFDKLLSKKSCPDTRSQVMKQIKLSEYLKAIKGSLKYDFPNPDMNNFNARLKLESYPRTSGVTIENFIMRGSTIKNVKAVYGLVVYTGMDTKIKQNLKTSKRKEVCLLKEERNIMFTTFTFLQNILLGIYCLAFIIFLLNSLFKVAKNHYSKEVISHLEMQHPYEEFFYSLYQFILTFHLIIPYNWFNLIYLAYYIMQKFILWDVKVRKSPKNKIEINNLDCLPHLGSVKFILADKTGTLTNRKFLLKGMTLRGKFYSMENPDRRDEGLFNFDGLEITELEIYQTLKSNFDDMGLKHFFTELCLCHSLKTWVSTEKNKDVFNNQTKFGSAFAEERATLKILENFGYYMTKANEDKVELKITSEGDKRVYEVIGRNRYSEKRKRSSMIYKPDAESDSSILLCKSYTMDVLQLLSNEQNKNEINLIEEQIKKMSDFGYRYVIFCRKELSDKETHSFIENYKSAENNMLQQELELELLALYCETGMELLGALFFEEECTGDLKFSLDKISAAGINTWVVSGDREENVVAFAKNIGMDKSGSSSTINIHEKDKVEEIDIKINQLLMQILGKNNPTKIIKLDSHENKEDKIHEACIFVHGKAFTKICGNTRLYQNFSLLLIYTSNFFGSSFSPHNKYLLTKMMKKFLAKNCKILAIGDGLNDLMMLKEADLSIGIRSREILQVKNTCDIIVSKFPQIVDLIIVHGTWNLNRVYKIAMFSLYSTIVIILPTLLAQFSSDSGSSFYNPDYILLLLSLFIINLSILIIFCLDQDVERSLLNISPHIYAENYITQSTILAKLGSAIIKGIIDSFVIFYGFYFVIPEPMNPFGFTLEHSNYWLIYLFTAYTLIYMKLMFIQLHIISVYSILLVFISYTGIACIGYIQADTFSEIIHLLSYFNVILAIFTAVFFCVIYDYAVSCCKIIFLSGISTKLTTKFKSLLEDYELFINYEENIKQFTNPEFPKERKEFTKFEDVVEVLNNDKQHGLDSTIENLSNINNNKIASMKLKYDLKFKNSKMESDYKFYFNTQIKMSYFYYLLTNCIFWVIYMIVEAVQNNLYEQKISCSLQIAWIAVGFVLLAKCFKDNFHEIFVFYLYVNIGIQFISVYLENANNDTKICIQFIVYMTYPLMFGTRHLISMSVATIVYFLGLIPAIFLNRFQIIENNVIRTNHDGNNTNGNIISNISSNLTAVVHGLFTGLNNLNNNTVNITNNMTNLFNNSTNILNNNNNSFNHLNGLEEEHNPYSQFIANNLPTYYNKTLLLFGTLLVMFIFGYFEEWQMRINFLKFVKKSNDKKKDDEIFDNLVPKFVQNKMKTGDRGTNKNKEEVTVIFAYITKFDSLVAKLSALELISLLDKIYNTFDQLCTIHGIQKIETVCNTYMACGGLKECEVDMDQHLLEKSHAMRSYEVSLDMIDIMSGIVLENGEKVTLKIGINTGYVLAGVIGEHKPQFSLIGDTVNTTARLGVKANDMCILCSEKSFNYIGMEYPDLEKREIQAKGKGTLQVYESNPIKKKMDAANVKMTNFKNFLTKFIGKAFEKVYGPDAGFGELLGGTKNIQKAVTEKKQNSDRSNQSDFIVEENNNEEVKDLKSSTPKKREVIIQKFSLDKSNNKIQPKSNFNQVTFESNLLFKHSCFLLGFKETNSNSDNSSSNPSVSGQSNNNNNSKNKNTIDTSPYNLYKKYKAVKYFNSIEKSIIINFTYGIIMLINVFNKLQYHNRISGNLVLIFVKILLILVLFYLATITSKYKKSKKTKLEFSYIIIYLLFMCLHKVQFNILNQNFYLETAMEQNLTIVAFGFISLIDYTKQFITQILFIFIIIMNIIDNKYNYLIIKYECLSIILSFTIFIFIILREYIATLDFINNQQVTLELKKSEELLFNLMPPHVVISLKEDRTVADEIDDVTILYTDIVNFTKFSAAQKDQSNIVRMLIELFKRMDNACVEYNVYKVHTIGDCFVVLGFTGKVARNERKPLEEAKQVIKVGRVMMDIIRTVRESKEVNFPDLDMRIGIHTVSSVCY